jgi:(1->4)-alpha-D-glucan 1-alpha-D-glucosylmutase
MARRCTYRVQLHKGFNFTDAADIADYLADIGVSHLYCSPYLQAVPGSTHGYDVADPQRISSDLGGAPGLARLTSALARRGLGQILDIVPNHMSADPKANRWWWDVLENGPSSLYAHFFDIEWDSEDERSAFTVLVPILADHYGRELEAGHVQMDRVGGSFVIHYFEHELPVSPRTIDDLLGRAARRAGSAELAELADIAAGLPAARLTDHAAVEQRHRLKLLLETRLASLCEDDPTVAAAVRAEVETLNSDTDRLDELLRRQNYRMAHWRTAREDLDYRRFFNIETLVGVRVEDPGVFDETHHLIAQLVDDGTLDGIRVDHVDGLQDPSRYLNRLAGATNGIYTVVEKILARGEELPTSWPIDGTSGYDFLNRANRLFVAREHESEFTDIYEQFTGETASYADVEHDAKQHVMRVELAAEVERVTSGLARICDRYRRHRDHTRRELRDALRELVTHMDVYRIYVSPGETAGDTARARIADAVNAARRCRPNTDGELLDFLGELAIGRHSGADEEEFTARLQQLTSPVMAKGAEDTAFYRYNRLISLNEVGGDPGTFGIPPSSFHEDSSRAAQNWPHAMLTLSTHDTKRSADVRARINVLSELPVAWRQAVERWAEQNETHRRDGYPDRNAEYLLYQSLVGAWPLDTERAVSFMAKATREAKVHTSWATPDLVYDPAVEHFVRAVLADRSWVRDLEDFLDRHRVVERGRVNSLAQTALLLTSPGIPDIYQGSEVWDLSLVDPDNRRPVDYATHQQLLTRLAKGPRHPGQDAQGQTKMWLIRTLLEHRAERPDIYDEGPYDPLSISGPHRDTAIGFSRRDLCVVAPVRTAVERNDTSVRLPDGRWQDLLTGALVEGGDQPVDDLLAGFPVATLVRS